MTLSALVDNSATPIQPFAVARLAIIGITAVFVQVMVIDPAVWDLTVGGQPFSLPLSLAVDVPLAVVAAVAVRRSTVAPLSLIHI